MKKVIILFIVLFFLTACESQNTQQLEAKHLEVNIQNFAFYPSEITINVGDTVTWTNLDDMQHTVTGDNFDSGTLNKGNQFKHTFTESGTYDYHCNFHGGMKGKVIVA